MRTVNVTCFQLIANNRNNEFNCLYNHCINFVEFKDIFSSIIIAQIKFTINRTVNDSPYRQ